MPLPPNLPAPDPALPRLGLGRPNRSRERLAFWYDSIIDWMLANPGGSLTKCAADLKRGDSTVRMVVNSDLFRARYEQRKRQQTEFLAEKVTLRSASIAMKALEVLENRLDQTPEKLSSGLVADIANSTLLRLGYGLPTQASAAPAQQVQVSVSVDVLKEAQQKMRTVQELNAGASPLELQAKPCSSDPGSPDLGSSDPGSDPGSRFSEPGALFRSRKLPDLEDL